MALTCILVDDEQKALTSLDYELGQFVDRIQVLERFIDARAAVEFVKIHAVDVVFLDVNMPGMNGMKFMDCFPYRDFEVVFTTAHSEYAVDAFKLEATGYLVKPIDSDDLETVVCRLEKKIAQGNFSSKIETALDRLHSLGAGPKKIKFTLDKKIVFIEPDDVVYCESDGNYCKVVLVGDKQLFLTQKLKQVQEAMPPDSFYRVHNSYLINLHKVKEFYKQEGYVVLDTGKKIPVSRQKRSDVLDRL